MLRRAFFCSHVVSVSGVLYNCLVDFDCFESPDEEELCAKSLAPSDCCRAALLVKQVRRLGESWSQKNCKTGFMYSCAALVGILGYVGYKPF